MKYSSTIELSFLHVKHLSKASLSAELLMMLSISTLLALSMSDFGSSSVSPFTKDTLEPLSIGYTMGGPLLMKTGSYAGFNVEVLATGG